ncbi:hypothetical protein AAHA92_28764 [Salvia divinorum]|uniref:Uncharacterized protein n=1 Tax=Salvia divinorum TaxID=28513 RepID=A0ABD1FZC1_SALDI
MSASAEAAPRANEGTPLDLNRTATARQRQRSAARAVPSSGGGISKREGENAAMVVVFHDWLRVTKGEEFRRNLSEEEVEIDLVFACEWTVNGGGLFNILWKFKRMRLSGDERGGC